MALNKEKSPDTTPGLFNTLSKFVRRGHNAQRQKSNRSGNFGLSPVLGTWSLRAAIGRIEKGSWPGIVVFAQYENHNASHIIKIGDPNNLCHGRKDTPDFQTSAANGELAICQR